MNNQQSFKTRLMQDGQIAKAMCFKQKEAMKEILNLGEFKMGGRSSPEYKFFRKVVMDQFYNSLLDIFETLVEKDVLQRCECLADIRDGYTECFECNGAGYKNSKKFNALVSSVKNI